MNIINMVLDIFNFRNLAHYTPRERVVPWQNVEVQYSTLSLNSFDLLHLTSYAAFILSILDDFHS